MSALKVIHVLTGDTLTVVMVRLAFEMRRWTFPFCRVSFPHVSKMGSGVASLFFVELTVVGSVIVPNVAPVVLPRLFMLH